MSKSGCEVPTQERFCLVDVFAESYRLESAQQVLEMSRPNSEDELEMMVQCMKCRRMRRGESEGLAGTHVFI